MPDPAEGGIPRIMGFTNWNRVCYNRLKHIYEKKYFLHL